MSDPEFIPDHHDKESSKEWRFGCLMITILIILGLAALIIGVWFSHRPLPK